MSAGTAVNYSFNHRHLVVDNVPETVAFYEGTLGAKKVQEMEFKGTTIIRMELDGLPLTISGEIQEGVGDHIGLAVDNFEEAISELREQGVEFILEPQDMGFAKFAFIKDSAGTTLEILHFASKE